MQWRWRPVPGARRPQRLDPQLPVLPAHHGNSPRDLLFGRWRDGGLIDLAGLEVHGLARERLANGPKRGGVLPPPGGSHAVDHQVHRAHGCAHELEGLALDIVCEGVAVQAPRPQAVLPRFLFEERAVVPARGGGPLVIRGPLVENANSVRPVSKCGGDAGSQAVPRGGPDDQDFSRPSLGRRLRPDVGNLLLDVLLAPVGMDREAHCATNSTFYSHERRY